MNDIPENNRHELAQFALAMIVADGVIDPREIEAVKKLYQTMGLTPDNVYSDLHALKTQSELVTDRKDYESERDHAIPPPSEHDSVILDPERVTSVMANTEHVSSILKNIFHDDEIEEKPNETSENTEEDFLGLDEQHATFLRELLTRPHWNEAEFATLTDHFQLMPKGTVETLNEWSFNRFGDVLIEEDEGYELNPDIVIELQKREMNDTDIRFSRPDIIVPG